MKLLEEFTSAALVLQTPSILEPTKLGGDLRPSPAKLRGRRHQSCGKEPTMRLDSFYPVLLTDDVARSSSFFTEHMGFRETFTSDWYVSLVHGGNDAYELALISHDHDTIPEGSRRPTSALLLNFEVPSVESEHERLRAAGVEILQPIEDLPAGQRHFICRGPGGVMVDVIEVVPPDPEYADRYVS
jgi:catechol 2,3-dioxygenase-like lactoylglutathione lyase family enzyme